MSPRVNTLVAVTADEAAVLQVAGFIGRGVPASDKRLASFSRAWR